MDFVSKIENVSLSLGGSTSHPNADLSILWTGSRRSVIFGSPENLFSLSYSLGWIGSGCLSVFSIGRSPHFSGIYSPFHCQNLCSCSSRFYFTHRRSNWGLARNYAAIHSPVFW